MSLIPKKKIDLNKEFLDDPIQNLFFGAMVVREASLPVRINLIAEFIQKLEKLHNQGEETFERNTYLGIGSLFGMATAVATSSALNPIGGMLLSGAAVLSWGASMYEVFNENTKLEGIKDQSLRLLLVLKSVGEDTWKWATLWQFAGDDIFVAALKEACVGHISGGKLIRLNDDTPLKAAIRQIAAYKGISYNDVVIASTGLMEGRQPQIKNIPAQPQYQPVPQTPPAPIATTPVMQPEVVYHPIPDPTQSTAIQQPVTVLQHESVEARGGSGGTRDIVDLILGCVNSLAFIGGQRCGKSLLMAIASRIGLNKGKFNQVFVISSLAKRGEDDHYWMHCGTQTFYDLAVIVDKTSKYEEFLKTIRQFKKTTNAENPQLLIIDEFPYLCERLEDDIKDGNAVAADLMKEIANIGSVVASGGAKRGWYIWLGSPKGAIGEMGRGGKVMKMFTLCFCAVAPGATVDSNGVDVDWDSGLYSATKLNFPALKEPARGIAEDLSDRIIFFNGKWYAKTHHDLSRLSVPQQQPKTITPTSVVTEDALMPQERAELNTVMSLTKPTEKTQTDILIEKIEQSKCSTLEGFIIRELKCANKLEEMMSAIPMILERVGRSDLLGKFQD